MTIREVIAQVDANKHNTYTDREKRQWLSELDAMVRQLITGVYNREQPPFCGYDERTPADTVLEVPLPYDRMYLHYLEAQIDYLNGEYDKYNNAMAMFQAVFDSYRNACGRQNLPKATAFRYF